MKLPKRPNYQEYEPRLRDFWEKKRFSTPAVGQEKKPFTILLPPPNANAPLHAGHAMYVVEDILCRYHRMVGDPTLFLPGTDHAGIETQYVFEKHLAQEQKSRLDYDRTTLYQMIHDFVEKNRGIATEQLRSLGFSLDWTRERYTLDPNVIKTVTLTFQRMHDENLIYRDERLVNYCTHCGTGFSNLEIEHVDRQDHLYYLDYGTITIATTRPETIFADVAVAVNPTDGRYQNLIGKTATIPIINKAIPIIADKAVDPSFGTGALKITPGHAHLDDEIGKRNTLERITVIDLSGRMTNVPENYRGRTVDEARQKVITHLREENKLEKEATLTHTVATCYKCENIIEPLLLPQWYVRVKPLADLATQAVKTDKVRFFPSRFKKEMLHWLKTAPDWNISRQIVWGIQIPVWYKADPDASNIFVWFLDKNEIERQGTVRELQQQGFTLDEIENGLQKISASTGPFAPEYVVSRQKPGPGYLPETDTFDTWFSSGQWPMVTLGYPDNKDFEYFYPTSVIDTMWDILPFWIMRMLMLGIYLDKENRVPFKWVHLHSRVVDSKGTKMSKSKGNVIDPLDLAKKYGTDALRFALVFNTSSASNVPLGEEKMIGARNFVTKLWNIARFALSQRERLQDVSYSRQINPNFSTQEFDLDQADRQILTDLNQVIESTTVHLKTFQFGLAADGLYDFIWNRLASGYLETTKNRQDNASLSILLITLRESLKLLHPFMPFVTEEIYQHLPNRDAESIMVSKWPKSVKISQYHPTINHE